MKYTIIVFALAIGLIKARLRVDKQWSGGFQGAIEIPIINQINNGWELEIRFDRPVTVDVSLQKEIYSFLCFIK